MSDFLVRFLLAAGFFILGQIVPRLREQNWFQRWLSRRRASEVERILLAASQGSAFRPFTGKFAIDMIRPLVPCVLPDAAIKVSDVVTNYTDKAKALPGEVELLRTTYLPQFISSCKQDKRKYSNDPAYSLDDFHVGREADEQRGRRLTLELYFSPTDFDTFAMSNLALREPLLQSGGHAVSIMERYGILPERLKVDQDHFRDIPLHMRCGTNTVVVTEDDLIVLLARSSSQAIAGGDPLDARRYLVGVVGEGMLRPRDANEYGRPDPFKTVERALRDELLLDASSYNPADIRLLAVNFDYKRCQPVLLFTLRLNVSSLALTGLWRIAKDQHEHSDMFFVANDPKEIQQVIAGTKRRNGRVLAPASNHVEMSLFLSQFYYHPPSAVYKAFANQK